jgi:hypothetical protein
VQVPNSVDGKPYEKLDKQFSFEEIKPAEKKAASSKHSAGSGSK